MLQPSQAAACSRAAPPAHDSRPSPARRCRMPVAAMPHHQPADAARLVEPGAAASVLGCDLGGRLSRPGAAPCWCLWRARGGAGQGRVCHDGAACRAARTGASWRCRGCGCDAGRVVGGSRGSGACGDTRRRRPGCGGAQGSPDCRRLAPQPLSFRAALGPCQSSLAPTLGCRVSVSPRGRHLWADRPCLAATRRRRSRRQRACLASPLASSHASAGLHALCRSHA